MIHPFELMAISGREIMKSTLGSEKKKFLAFLSCTRYCGGDFTDDIKSHEDMLQRTEGYVALGGGGLALFGTACLYTWPEKFEDIIPKFEDNTCVDRTQFLDDSCYRLVTLRPNHSSKFLHQVSKLSNSWKIKKNHLYGLFDLKQSKDNRTSC